jgi:Tfp pilus assembly PilM family ATPase
MRLCFKRSLSPIGLDLGARTVKAAQLAHCGKGWRLYAASMMPLPKEETVSAETAAKLRDALWRQGFVGDDVVLAAPTERLQIDVLDLPPRASGAPVEQIARVELARNSKFEDDAFETSCWDLPATSRTGGATSAVMAMALSHKDAQTMIDPLERAGLNVVGIDARPWALARACAKQKPGPGMTAVVDLGWKHAIIALVRDGVLFYQRVSSEAGLGIAHRAICDQFSLEEDEADYVLMQIGAGEDLPEELAALPQSAAIRELIVRHLGTVVNEVELAFHYAMHRNSDAPPQGLFVVGGGSLARGVPNFLSQRIGTRCPVQALAPFAVAECPPAMSDRARNCALVPAIGLAMHESN